MNKEKVKETKKATSTTKDKKTAKSKKSARSKVIEKILKIAGSKARFTSEENAQKYLNKCRKKNRKIYKAPKLYNELAHRRFFDEVQYYKFDGEEKTIIYLHGGAFVARPLIFHWSFLKDIFEKTEATIYFPLYPLAPEASYKETYRFLLKFYKFVLSNHSPKIIILMGDSAGGTLILGLIELLKRKNLPLPAKVIPLSPCMDITFTNKKIDNLEDKDPMLSKVGCALICGYWARGAGAKEPLVNPKFVATDNFPETHIFVGTHEILHPDIMEFAKKNKAINGRKIFENVAEMKKNEAQDLDLAPSPRKRKAAPKSWLTVYEIEGMNHVFPLFPIPEADIAEDIIANLIISPPVENK